MAYSATNTIQISNDLVYFFILIQIAKTDHYFFQLIIFDSSVICNILKKIYRRMFFIELFFFPMFKVIQCLLDLNTLLQITQIYFFFEESPNIVRHFLIDLIATFIDELIRPFTSLLFGCLPYLFIDFTFILFILFLDFLSMSLLLLFLRIILFRQLLNYIYKSIDLLTIFRYTFKLQIAIQPVSIDVLDDLIEISLL